MPAIKPRNEPKAEVLPPRIDSPQGPRTEFRVSERVEAKLNPYIEAHPKDLEHYRRLISENPDRAARTLMLKDLEMFEVTMKQVLRQLPQAKEFYDKQTPEVKKRIDESVAKVNPYHHDQAFVGEVMAEVRRQSFTQVFGKKPATGAGTAPAAGAPAAAMSAG
jgi:hypothetical protein